MDILKTMSIFGWKAAITYVVPGLVIAVTGGTIIEKKLRLDNHAEEFMRSGTSIDAAQERLYSKGRMEYAWAKWHPPQKNCPVLYRA